MPVSPLDLGLFNKDGFKEANSDWNDMVISARSSDGDVQQLVAERRPHSAFLVKLFKDSPSPNADKILNILKYQFRTSKNVEEEEAVLLQIIELICLDLRRSPPSTFQSTGQDQPYDHLWSVLMEREDMAEDVVIAFFQNPDLEIRRIAPLYLRSFLMSAFANYKSKSVLKSIWRYLNRIPGDHCRKLIRDIIVLSCNRSMQAELLSISFEYLDVDQHHSDAVDFLLLLTIRLQDEKSDPKLKRYLNVINEMIDILKLNSSQLEVILYSIGRLLEQVNVFVLPVLVNLITKILAKSQFSSLTLNTILDPVIQWFSRPCPFIPPDTYREFESFLQKAQHSKRREIILEDISSWNDLMLHDKDVTVVIYYSRLNIALEINPNRIGHLIGKWKRLCPVDFSSADIRLLRALILSPHFGSHLKDILEQFKLIIRVNKSPQAMALTPLLFKLVQERDAMSQLLLLKVLPEFSNSSNIPIIFSTIKKFEKISGLDLVCLELYHQMTTREYRVSSRLIQHLEYLQLKRNKSFEMCLAMITIIRRICQQKKGGQNCREMVKFISHIINEDSANRNDGVVMVIALDAIQILCENQTINVQSTWMAIKENFRNEDRKNVKIKLYSFFSAMPQLADSDEGLLDEIMGILWKDLMEETDPEIIENIFRALKAYPFESMCFIRFPELFRQNVKLPKSHLITMAPEEYAASFPYIPGECWIELLEKVPRVALASVWILIAKFIDLELKALRTPTNALPEGRQEPKTITGVQPKSILKALLNYLVVETRNDLPETEHIRVAIFKCLSCGFSKPMPHFDWTFLGDVYERTMELRDDCLRIVSRQVENSVSARKFLVQYLAKLDMKTCGLQQVLILLENFHVLEKCLNINEAELLLRSCLESPPSSDNFELMLKLLNVEELNADLRRIVEEVLMQRFSQMSDEDKDSDKWFGLVAKMGNDFVKELTQPLTEELRIKRQVDLMLKSPETETSTDKIILLQLIASKVKLSKDSDELEFYGNLLIRMVVELSNLNAIDVLVEGRESWGRYLQVLVEQPTVKEGLNQVLTCLSTRLTSADDKSGFAYHLKRGLCGTRISKD